VTHFVNNYKIILPTESIGSLNQYDLFNIN